MEVIVRPGGSRSAGGQQLRITWRGIEHSDRITARAESHTGDLVDEFFGGQTLSWIRQQPARDRGTWLLDLGQLPADVTAVELSLDGHATPRPISLVIETLDQVSADVVQHAGALAPPGQPWLVLSVRRTLAGSWDICPLDGTENDDGDDPMAHVPEHLKSAARRARTTHLVTDGATVLVSLDLSASMRPWLVSGLAAEALGAALALAGAAGASDLETVTVGSSVPPNRLPLTTSTTEFLIAEVGARGLSTGDIRQLVPGQATGLQPHDLVVMITDTSPPSGPPAAGRCRMVAVILGQDRPAATGGSVSLVFLGGQQYSTEGIVDLIGRSLSTT